MHWVRLERRPVLFSFSLALALASFGPGIPSASADPVLYVSRGSTWKFFRGQSEASSPDTTAWRSPVFSESGWQSGAVPIGYGESGIVTDLSLFSPPMEGNYSSVFLRKTFSVPDPSAVNALEVNFNYDDGFVIWINGAEVLRVNMPGAPGDPVAFNDFASTTHEFTNAENLPLPDPEDYLFAGTNVMAVQVFNNQINSSDLYFDLELFDPFGADVTPPVVAAVVPAAGATVRTLTQIGVTFSEDVSGVNAADLRINGAAASSAPGSGPGPYLFTFSQPAAGTVNVTWAGGHGITDQASPPNAFGGGAWSYTLDPSAAQGDVVLSEFLAANRGGITDEDGETSDWIEIYNRGAVTADLSGWGLTDDVEEPAKWTFPSVSLAPGGRLVVFASGKDRRPLSGNLHANFQLNSDGEYLGFYTPESPPHVVSEFRPQFPEQRPDISYGADSGGTPHYLDPPTPRASNSSSAVLSGLVLDPRFSPPRGFYDDPVLVALSTPTPGASMYYTQNGSEPTPANGTLYASPFSISGTSAKAVVVVRAAAYRSGYLPSRVMTHSYIFTAHVLTQPANPAGFPTSWGSAPAVDYAVDPEIVNDPQYRDLVLEGLRDLPTISIVMRMEDIFGPSGIYSNTLGDGVQWERAASAEFIDPGAGGGMQIDCGIRIQGGASREPVKSPKHSLRLLFKGDYGATKLRTAFFPDSPVTSFDSIHLRANYNNSWIHWDSAQRRRAQMTHDQFARDTQLAMGQLSAHGNYMHVYINGLYWGVYNPSERPTASFAASYLGGEKEEYDSLNSGVVRDGNRTAWNTMMGLSNAGLASLSQYEAIQAYLDVPGLIDYMLINFYGSNQDWPSHNWFAIRRREPGAGYKFVSWDAERTLEVVSSNSLSVSDNDTPAGLYSQLRANAEFRLLFADRVHRHLFNGGTLTPEKVAARWMARAGEVDKAVACESARWGDYRRDVHPYSNGPYEFYTKNAFWLPEQSRLLNQYFPQRSGVLVGQLRAASLYPNTGAPVFNQHGGTISPGFSLAMTLPAGTTGTIFYTTDGTDPRSYGTGAAAPGAQTYSGPVVLGDTTQVRARTLNAGAWSALNEATFTVLTPAEALRISEIMYNPAGGSDAEFVELQNTGAFTLDLFGVHFSEGISFVFAENFPLGPGEFAVLVSNPDAFASRYPSVPIAGVYTGSLANEGEKLSVEEFAGSTTVFSVGYDDEGFWPLGPDGFGYSLVLLDAGADPDDPLNWRASAALHGSPGRADPSPVHGGVVINEILARSGSPLEDAIELFNASDRAEDVSGWYLSDSREDEASLRKYRIPAGNMLPPGGYMVLYENEFNPEPGVPPSFGLNGDGGAVYLAAASAGGSLTGYVTGHEYGGAGAQVSFGRYATSAGLDFTLLAARTFGADAPLTVQEFRMGEGAPNASPLVGPVVINEVHYHPLEVDEEFVELRNLSGASVALHDGALGRGWRLSGLRNADETNDYEFPPGTAIAAGGFLLVVPIDAAVFRGRHAVPAGVSVLGPYGGALDNSGEWIRLFKPLGNEEATIAVDQVRYNDRLPWPLEPDGGGPSLERLRGSDYGNEPANWAASLLAGGTPGGANSVSDPGVNQRPLASFLWEPQPEPLAVRFDASESNDPDGVIVRFEWDFGEGFVRGSQAMLHTFPAAGTYEVELRVTDDDGAPGTASRLVTLAGPDPGGYQLPGDSDQDGLLDISDALSLLLRIFPPGQAPRLPCSGASVQEMGNKTLLNVNGDSAVNLADALYLLNYLFQSGPHPVQGSGCTPILGCPDACAP